MFPSPLTHSVLCTYRGEGGWGSHDMHTNRQNQLIHETCVAIRKSVTAVKLLHATSLSGVHPHYDWSPQRAIAWLRKKRYPHSTSRAEPMGHLEAAPGALENEDLYPADPVPVTGAPCFTVCICAQVHRRCEAFMHYLVTGHNYRLHPPSALTKAL